MSPEELCAAFKHTIFLLAFVPCVSCIIEVAHSVLTTQCLYINVLIILVTENQLPILYVIKNLLSHIYTRTRIPESSKPQHAFIYQIPITTAMVTKLQKVLFKTVEKQFRTKEAIQSHLDALEEFRNMKPKKAVRLLDKRIRVLKSIGAILPRDPNLGLDFWLYITLKALFRTIVEQPDLLKATDGVLTPKEREDDRVARIIDDRDKLEQYLLGKVGSIARGTEDLMKWRP